ncbi:MerR family transcriptional regulator [Ktedonosporobacter rubrisoli]|uniref:MerR family transcriptional regulator n=1 Tax=Ktedonosporobacter rubrisoli TaxID=2509675 RepID=A0A4P6JR80_KTERU|nr:MerR family transcriptional regulator [Ktedonosporobacter rubrisoli]QBD77793.1 MerR family transcriptional regulator [Ktedonosporobacter rubrisoli]
MQEELTIQEVATRTGLSVYALRYYERVGLLDPVGRASSGHRRYTSDDLTWISFLQCLRTTGMSIRQMQTFADLRRQGDPSARKRLEFLECHEQQVQKHLDELERNLVVIRRKIERHKAMLANEQIEAEHGNDMPEFKVFSGSNAYLSGHAAGNR